MPNEPQLNEQVEKITGRTLSKKWGVQVSHALYREDGTWYHILKRFPGALFDQDGYLLFETEEDLENCPQIIINRPNNHLIIKDGIRKIPGYIRMSDVVQDDADTNDDINDEYTDLNENTEIDVREDNSSVFEWIRRLDKNLLVTDPDFQRNVVWTIKQKSQFVESILLNMPLPPIYVNQSSDGKYILVDGLQRTTSLQEFIKGEFELTGLKILKSINNKSFNALPSPYQVRIEDRKLFVFVIKPSAPLSAVYEIFYRINTGGTQLNRQEIRNCLHIGEATRLLHDLAESNVFRDSTSEGFSPKRMKDREAVLRCIAFANFDYEHRYDGNMDGFLGRIMDEINQKSQNKEFLENIRKQFLTVMQQTFDVFGEGNFRPPAGSEDGKGRINIAVMESVYRFFAKSDRKFYSEAEHKTLIRNYKRLFQDPQFVDAIQRSTSGKQRVILRLETAMLILGEK